MAERTAVFNLKINDGNSAEKVAKNEKELAKLRKTTESATKSNDKFKNEMKRLDAILDSNNFTMEESNKLIEEYSTIALQAGSTSPIGAEAINKAAALTDRMDKLRTEVRTLSNDGKNLQGAMQLSQGVLGSYQAFTGITAMMGVENEALMETMVRLQAVQQVSMGLEQTRMAFQKGEPARVLLNTIRTKALAAGTLLYAGAQKAVTLATGTSTAATKLFSKALVATGIGAIVVGIGLLVANFDKVVSVVTNVVERFKGMGEGFKTLISIVFPFIGMIRLVVAGLEALGIIEDDNDRARAAQQQRALDGLKKEQKELDKKISKKQQENKQFEENSNFELRMMKAQGKSKEEIITREKEIRQQKILNNIAEQHAIKLANDNLIATYKLQQAKGDLSNEDAKRINEEIRANNELMINLKESNKSMREEILISDAEYKKSLEQDEEKHQEKLKSSRQKAADEKKQADKEADQEEKKRQQDLQQLKEKFQDLANANIEDEEKRERAILETKHERELAIMAKEYGEKTEQMIQLKKNQEAELAKLETDSEAKKTEKEKIDSESKREEDILRLENDIMFMELDAQTKLQKEIELEQARRDALLAGVEEGSEEERKIIGDSEQKVKDIRQKGVDDEKQRTGAIRSAQMDMLGAIGGGIKELAAISKNGEAVQKGIALAEIASQTAMGFVRGLGLAQEAAKTAGPAAPFVFGAFYASQIGAVLAAANKAKGILGKGGGGVSAPSASMGNVGGVNDRGAEDTTNVNEANMRQGESTEDQKVFVSETDISRTQKRVTDIQVRSVF